MSTEVALALMLLVSATALLRSFGNLLDVDPGFRTEDVVSVALELPQNQYRAGELQKQFYNELVDRVAALPGVASAGAVSDLPMSSLGIEFDLPFEIPGRDAPTPGERPRAEYRAVIPGYFEALGISLIRGRLFDRFDRQEGHPVMVINETMERVNFSGVDAIGQHLGVPMAGSIEIVGVVADVRHDGLGEDTGPEMFVSYQNFPLRQMHVVAHSNTTDAGALIRAIQAEVRSLDPQLPMAGSATLAELLSGSMAGARFNTILLSIFSTCALVLAAVGIYGVVSYSVAQRTAEIGMRMALGAGPKETMRLVLRQALGFVAVGSVVGIVGAALLARWIRGMLFEVTALNPVAVAGVVAFLVATAVLAAWAPARRAMRVDPVAALRN
jgi:putative ABC transport system permease protein